MEQRLSRLRTPFTILVAALLGVGLVLLYLQLDPPSGKYSDADIQALAQKRIDAITPTPPVEPAIYAKLRPSVVLVYHDATGADASKTRDLGSGVVVDESGSILTAYHVVSDSDTVSVRFFDGTTLTGTVTQKQPENDLAIVQVTGMPQGVVAATLAGGVREGDRVLAIGAPFGLDASVSAGVVSGLGRTFPVEGTNLVLHNMIQFDAAANPGNSGGPLVDMNGHVVGIVTGIVNPTGQEVFVGIGFATPIESSSGLMAPIS